MNIIPKPKQFTYIDGYHQITHCSEIVLEAQCDFDDFEIAKLLQDEILEKTGLSLQITKSYSNDIKKCIYLRVDDTNAEDESYNLSINSDMICIKAASHAGLFYGIQSLRQLIREYNTRIPCMEIADEPIFKNRGFYHDITRGRVPTLETLKDLVDRASFYKLNQLQLYIEHTFAFKKYSEIWRGADPLTAQEIIELDVYCKKRHIDLVPSLATFGHLYHTFSSRTLKEFCELEVNTDEPFSWVDRMSHHTLDVSNPGSLEFIKSTIDEFIPLFSSKKFNICCDETFDLGNGKNKELAQKVGKDRLYLDFLLKVVDHVRKYDKEVMFWGDIILEYPESLKEIPKDVTCLNWWYWGRPDENRIIKVAESSLPQYLCPAVLGWNNIMSYIDLCRDNILHMTELGVKYGAIGILNTDWGDFGNVNLYSTSIPGMILGADLSWNPEGWAKSEEAYNKISFTEYGDASTKLVGLLSEIKRDAIIDNEWAELTLWCYQRILNRSIGSYTMKPIENYDSESLKKCYDKLSNIHTELINIMPTVYPERRHDIDELIIATRGTALIRALFLIIQKYEYKMEVGELILSPVDLAEQFEYWMVDYSKAWRYRNKESELSRISEIIFAVCNRLRDFGILDARKQG